ncbi:hypothetical protein M0R45_004281 [Rubus argutus]|uniref:Uncharacterized protein n=1 Tax=Rubus argutus TaxID=59490 RepID=A0AAW1YJB2_RUBAR
MVLLYHGTCRHLSRRLQVGEYFIKNLVLTATNRQLCNQGGKKLVIFKSGDSYENLDLIVHPTFNRKIQLICITCKDQMVIVSERVFATAAALGIVDEIWATRDCISLFLMEFHSSRDREAGDGR